MRSLILSFTVALVCVRPCLYGAGYLEFGGGDSDDLESFASDFDDGDPGARVRPSFDEVEIEGYESSREDRMLFLSHYLRQSRYLDGLDIEAGFKLKGQAAFNAWVVAPETYVRVKKAASINDDGSVNFFLPAFIESYREVKGVREPNYKKLPYQSDPFAQDLLCQELTGIESAVVAQPAKKITTSLFGRFTDRFSYPQGDCIEVITCRVPPLRLTSKRVRIDESGRDIVKLSKMRFKWRGSKYRISADSDLNGVCRLYGFGAAGRPIIAKKKWYNSRKSVHINSQGFFTKVRGRKSGYLKGLDCYKPMPAEPPAPEALHRDEEAVMASEFSAESSVRVEETWSQTDDSYDERSTSSRYLSAGEEASENLIDFSEEPQLATPAKEEPAAEADDSLAEAEARDFFGWEWKDDKD